VVQGIVTQGHTHSAAGQAFSADAAHGLVLADAGKAGSNQTPSNDHERNCPICQAASIAAVAYAPSAPILRVPALSALFVPRDERGIVVERFVAAWRSRAPPFV
jgi:hypothetical protein